MKSILRRLLWLLRLGFLRRGHLPIPHGLKRGDVITITGSAGTEHGRIKSVEGPEVVYAEMFSPTGSE